jgi:hypothetical protein
MESQSNNINNSINEFMDVDIDDDCNNLINCPEESQEFKKFTSIFSNETGSLSLSLFNVYSIIIIFKIDFQAFLDVLEKKENDSNIKVNISLSLSLS